jgi:hypothetical protein
MAKPQLRLVPPTTEDQTRGFAGVAALDGFASLVGRELRCGRASHRPPWRVRPTCVRTQISSRSNSTKPPMGTPGRPRVLFWRLDEMTCYNNN